MWPCGKPRGGLGNASSSVKSKSTTDESEGDGVRGSGVEGLSIKAGAYLVGRGCATIVGDG